MEACGAAASTAAAKPRTTAAAAIFCHHIRKWVQTIDSATPAETAHTHKGLTPIAVPTVTTAASAFTHYIYFLSNLNLRISSRDSSINLRYIIFFLNLV